MSMRIIAGRIRAGPIGSGDSAPEVVTFDALVVQPARVALAEEGTGEGDDRGPGRRGGRIGEVPAVRNRDMVTGEVLYQQGAFAEAERRLRPAADALVAAPDLFNASRAGGRLGHCYLRLGDVDQAVATLEDHRHRIAAHHLRSFWCRNVWTGLAAAGLLIAEQAAESGRERALNEAKEACLAVLKHAKVDRGALCAGYRTRGTYEWLAGRRRKAERWWRKSLAAAEELGARYEAGCTHLEMGRRLGDRSELLRAETVFAAIGAAVDLAMTRDLLDPDGRDLVPSEAAPRAEAGPAPVESLLAGGGGSP